MTALLRLPCSMMKSLLAQFAIQRLGDRWFSISLDDYPRGCTFDRTKLHVDDCGDGRPDFKAALKPPASF